MTDVAGSRPDPDGFPVEGPDSDQLELVVDPTSSPPVIVLRGELDPHTAPRLERAIDDLLVDGPVDLVLDLGGLGFVDSSGLRVLIAAQQRLADAGRTLALRSPSDTVHRLLEITGLLDHLTITEREVGDR